MEMPVSKTPEAYLGGETALKQSASSEGTVLAKDLLQRCQDLLAELKQFNDFLKEAKIGVPGNAAEYGVDIKQFHSSVQTELKSLQKVR